MDMVGLEKTTPVGAAIIAAMVSGFVVGGGYVAQAVGAPVWVKGFGVLAMLVGAALAGVLFRGGVIDRNPYDRPEVLQQARSAE